MAQSLPRAPQAAKGESVLTVQDMSVRLNGSPVLTRITFTVERGASLAIVGPNGAGKTVLLKALIGAVPATGTFRWAPDVRIGYVPQKLDITRDVPITGIDFLKARIALDRRASIEIPDVLASVGLSMDAGRQPIGALSGGQFQRLLVAFALVSAPNVLLLDEPTVGVDEPGQERLNELVHRLQREQGLTVILVSHDLSIVYRYATTVLCLSGHRACAFGPPRTILTPELLGQVYGSPLAFHVHEH
jgi:zinc transport system ATP-binding protein